MKKKSWFGTPLNEQETVIQISRTENKANVYSTDTLMIGKLDKVAKRKKEILCDNKIAAVEYEVDKKLIKVTAPRKKRVLTAEEKLIMTDRLKKARKK